MSDNKQVDKSHYEFHRYMDKGRWCSIWHQLDEVLRLKPANVLEIGPGPGVFKYAAKLFGLDVETLDLDPELKPDHVGSSTELPFADDTYDAVCAFQMLEHLPYERSLTAFREMVRVARKHVVISLPDSKKARRYQFYVPALGTFDRLFTRPGAKAAKHDFDGEHYWEINKQGYDLSKVTNDLSSICKLQKTYRVMEYSYHRFFVFEKA